MSTILFLSLVVVALYVAPVAGQVTYCPAYSATNTASATTNYVTCTINACNGYYTIGVCSNGGTYTGDTYLSLVSSTGTVLVTNDDSCNHGSQIKYTVTTGCQTLTLRQGCFDTSSCTGTVSIASVDLTATPSRFPSREPTTGPPNPTATPTITPSLTPSAMPTFSPSRVPTAVPTAAPTAVPTETPSTAPSAIPTDSPSYIPTVVPTAVPSAVPTATPTATPSAVPTASPSSMPSSEPSSAPSSEPSSAPSSSPTSPAEGSSLSRREKSLIVLAITLPVVVVGMALLLIPVYCFFFASQMYGEVPSNKDVPSAPTAIEMTASAASVPEKDVFYDVLAVEDNTANI